MPPVVERETPAAPASALDEVLRAVNRIRTDHGADPLYALPKGRPAMDAGSSCVLQNAFADLGVTYADYRYLCGPDLRIEHGLGPFIRGFDAGRYPQLLA
jgi:hypothetical protein